jgi:alpha-beta hydrolase superfamily lysophospholipase
MKHFRGGIRGYIASAAILGVLAYGGVAGFFYVGQETLIFRPTPLPASHSFNLPETKEISLAVDGATISALHFKQPDAKGVIFFLHGNGGNLSSWLRTTDFYRKTNFDVFMFDYRGYGKSTGTIDSEAQLHRDVMTAWQSVAPQYAGKKLVIYGRSLGATLAAKLSADVASDLTVLVSPFYNLNAMREAHYAWLPASLMRYTFTTDQWLPQAKSPVLILHGIQDELIEVDKAMRLKALVPNVELVKIDGGTHNNLHQLPQYIEPLSAKLAKL